MSKTKFRVLLASNSQKRRHHLLDMLVKLNYQVSCTVASNSLTRQSTLRVPRPEIILYDLCDEPQDEAVTESQKLAAHLQCPVLYVTKAWDCSQRLSIISNGVIPSEKICSIAANATRHELDLAIENRILKSTIEELAIARQHETWSFEAMSSALSVSSNFEQSTSATLGILGTTLNASCAIIQESIVHGTSSEDTSVELASSGTRHEPLSDRTKRLSDETMNLMRNFPYLQLQRIKNTKAATEMNSGENLWMPRSALVTNITLPNSPCTFLCAWWEHPRHHTDSDLRVASFAALYLAIACATKKVIPKTPLFADRQRTLREGA